MLTISDHELLCDRCPAKWVQQVELYGQDFKFCQHHFNELEPTFVSMLDHEDLLEEAAV